MAESDATPVDMVAIKKQVDEVLQCCREGNTARLREMILNENADEVLGLCVDPATGKTTIHIAAALGNVEMLELLLEYGAPWNAVDNEYRTAGDDAEQAGQKECHELLLNHGCRSELILGLLGRKEAEEGGDDDMEVSPNPSMGPDYNYLAQPLHYSEDGTKLLDSDNNAVMMSWEGPLMVKHAEVMCPTEGKHVLNIGFGLGLIDTALQERKPATHTIVEAHPDVYNHMLKLGWDKKPGVKIVFGKWQDVVDQLETYDGIFWDTFGEDYDDQREFHALVPQLLKPDGIFTFFNGLGGGNKFFNDVYCRLAELELQDLGFQVEYMTVPIDTSSSQLWDGVKRKYYSLSQYQLPLVRFA